MNYKKITIAIDAMGGENSPFKTLKGAEFFSQNNHDVNLIFLGNEDLIKQTIQKKKISLI